MGIGSRSHYTRRGTTGLKAALLPEKKAWSRRPRTAAGPARRAGAAVARGMGGGWGRAKKTGVTDEVAEDVRRVCPVAWMLLPFGSLSRSKMDRAREILEVRTSGS